MLSFAFFTCLSVAMFFFAFLHACFRWGHSTETWQTQILTLRVQFSQPQKQKAELHLCPERLFYGRARYTSMPNIYEKGRLLKLCPSSNQSMSQQPPITAEFNVGPFLR